jgi:hypothetical protein
LNIYGNTAQQLAASKYKMLWVLALLEARLPRKFRKNATDHGNSTALGGWYILWVLHAFFLPRKYVPVFCDMAF